MVWRRKKVMGTRPLRAVRRSRVDVEELEPRNLLSIFTPAQIAHAYGLDNISFGGIKGDGTGQTIAIVDAYNNPNIGSDLHHFDQVFGLPDPVLTKVTPQGTPFTNSGWALEIDLDVEWAHAMAPGANIMLVEARTSSFSNLFSAVDTARNAPGVSVVSMSWGADESFLSGSFEAGSDAHFTTPAGHRGVTFVASSGDNGGVYGPDYPAVSPNVVSVGGTSLVTSDSQGTYSSETAWSGSTGGVSSFEPEPSYQQGVQKTGFRTSPDVAMVGDPNTGVYVYTSVPQQGYVGWFQVGGTSVGAPVWSALFAIADQGRALQGKGSLDSRHDTLPDLYNLPSTDFHQITSGSNDAGYSAGSGYNLVTGRGTPVANRVVADLVKAGGGVQGSAILASGSRSASGTASGGGKGAAGPHAVSTSGSTLVSDATIVNSLTPTQNVRNVNAAATAVNFLTTTSTAPATTVAGVVLSSSTSAAPRVDARGGYVDDNSSVPVMDDGGGPAPSAPISPGSRTDPEGTPVPSAPMLEEVYEDNGMEDGWTLAFAGSSRILPSAQTEENGVADTSVGMAVALGFLWVFRTEVVARRRRPALVN
jgi:subtilase family serine protease